MALRQGWIIGASVGIALASVPALGQTPPAPPAGQPGAVPVRGARPAAFSGSVTYAPTNAPRTLAGALGAAYLNNPALQAARAQLRATDERVPQALAGWRPTVTIAGNIGAADGWTQLSGNTPSSRTDRLLGTVQATVTQPVYRGGQTRAQTNQAENQVTGQRARLLAQEQTTLMNVVNAYVGVIQDQQILALNINNEQVLARQLQATNDRFRVGEITRTDVAQAEAALAGATAQRESSQGTLATARGTFLQTVGFLPPADLVEPQPLRLPVRNQQEAVALSAVNNPTVVAAAFDDAAARDNIDLQISALMPRVNVTGQAFQNTNQTFPRSYSNGGQVLATLSVPLYQGGAEYSAVRQARQTAQQTRKTLDDARRTAIQNATNFWETLVSARAQADSTRSQIRANTIALEGVEREAIVGSRTTLDVLNAQQALLNSQVTLVQNLASVVTASYNVAVAIGRMTATDLALQVPIYDETAYYNAVRNRWGGTGDFATDQPGR